MAICISRYIWFVVQYFPAVIISTLYFQWGSADSTRAAHSPLCPGPGPHSTSVATCEQYKYGTSSYTWSSDLGDSGSQAQRFSWNIHINTSPCPLGVRWNTIYIMYYYKINPKEYLMHKISISIGSIGSIKLFILQMTMDNVTTI